MSRANYHPLTIETLAEWLTWGRRFAFVRYGDGEFALIEHSIEQNCDGVPYSDELAKGLVESIHSSEITHGLTTIAVHLGAKDWVTKNAPDIDWYHGDQIQSACDNGDFWPLRVAIFNRKMLYIGPERLRMAAQEALGADDLLEVPLTTAFEQVDEIVERAERLITSRGYDLVCISAGPAAKIIVDRLSRKLKHVSFIDFGSVLDVYAGTPTRSGSKKLTPKQVIALAWKNFHWVISEPLSMPYPSIHDLMNIPGLVSESEANFLYKTALGVKGTIVELGTFRGRTAAILARTGNQVISVDNYTYPIKTYANEPERNLAKFGLKARFINADSASIPKNTGQVALLYVDSDHSYAHVTKELDVWLPKVTDIAVFHDYGKETYQAVTKAVDEKMRGWTLIGRERTMAAFRRG